MISSTLGAPLGGTMRAGHAGLESCAESLITPANFGGAGGSCRPSMVVVALGAPGAPVVCTPEEAEDRDCDFGIVGPLGDDSQAASTPSASTRTNGNRRFMTHSLDRDVDSAGSVAERPIRCQRRRE